MKSLRIFIDRNRGAISSLAAIAILATLLIITGQTSANTGLGSVGPAKGNIALDRRMRIVSTNAVSGGQVVVSIELDSLGDEVAASFTLSFDPTIFVYQSVALGSGAPGGTTLNLNTNEVLNGRLGVLVFSGSPYALSPPARQVVTVTFNIPSGTTAGTRAITFQTSPTPLSMSSLLGVLLPVIYEVGTVTITIPPPAPVIVGGKVTTPTGQNLRNAVVTLTDANNIRRTATTSSFGLYSFDNVLTGATYTVTVSSKRYRFSPRIIDVTAAITDLNFVGLE